MAFVLEKITEEIQQKILNNLKFDESKFHEVQSTQYFSNNKDINIAIDHEHDSYFFLAPRFMREDSGLDIFYFYFKGVFYKIHTEGLFGMKIFYDDPLPKESLVAEFKERLFQAISVHGRHGKGQGKYYDFDTLNPEL